MASVSPNCSDVYAEDGITLDQLMAFTVNDDHERQERVFERLRQSYTKEPHAIRMLRRRRSCGRQAAEFVGFDADTNTGGRVVNADVFESAMAVLLQDVGLLDRLVANNSTIEPRRLR